ncbi:hypothetical protein AAU61_04210 [Desulfocarbo indianensis]|nr:hypothetical protein AAU61_04210 [Desulfocarbo indianensis]
MRNYLAILALLLFIAACGAPPPEPAQPRAGDFSQPLVFRVLDSMDRPVGQARIALQARKGQPTGPADLATDKYGEATVAWRPQMVDHTKGTSSKDEVFALASQLDFTVSKPGYFPARGTLEALAKGRRLYDPKLKGLSSEPVLAAKTATVVLRRPAEVLGGELAGRPLDGPLSGALLKFHAGMALVVPHLGVEFAWPAFELRQQELTMRFGWRGASWTGLGEAPLLGQVTAGSLLPLARAVGEELAGVPGVDRVRLEVLAESTPPDDPYALPAKSTVSLVAPLQAYAALAANQMTPDQFLVKHAPSLAVEEPPRTASQPDTAPALKADGAPFPHPGRPRSPAAGGPSAPQAGNPPPPKMEEAR